MNKPKKPRSRKCKAVTNGERCQNWFIPEKSFQRWCSDDCAVVMADMELQKIRAKQAVVLKKAREKKAKEERKKHRERKRELRPISWYHNKARAACNAYIRFRDRNEICISCDKPLAFEDKYDAGHWKTQGAHKWIAYDEVNVNGQCVSCNCYKDGNEAAQRPRLIAKWGIEEVERLEQSGKNLGDKSYTRDELLDIEKHYKQKLKELQEKEL